MNFFDSKFAQHVRTLAALQTVRVVAAVIVALLIVLGIRAFQDSNDNDVPLSFAVVTNDGGDMLWVPIEFDDDAGLTAGVPTFSECDSVAIIAQILDQTDSAMVGVLGIDDDLMIGVAADADVEAAADSEASRTPGLNTSLKVIKIDGAPCQ